MQSYNNFSADSEPDPERIQFSVSWAVHYLIVLYFVLQRLAVLCFHWNWIFQPTHFPPVVRRNNYGLSSQFCVYQLLSGLTMIGTMPLLRLLVSLDGAPIPVWIVILVRMKLNGGGIRLRHLWNMVHGLTLTLVLAWILEELDLAFNFQGMARQDIFPCTLANFLFLWGQTLDLASWLAQYDWMDSWEEGGVQLPEEILNGVKFAAFGNLILICCGLLVGSECGWSFRPLVLMALSGFKIYAGKKYTGTGSWANVDIFPVELVTTS